MSSSGSAVLPWECQDKEYQAKTIYESPFRRANQALSEENLRLKRILRENGISWSPVAQARFKQMGPTMRRSRQRKSNGPGYPHLPPEVIRRILRFALTGAQPIVDPLSPTTSEHLTEQEKARGNQIAIHFLATCRALPPPLRGTEPQLSSQNNQHPPSHVAHYFDDQRRKHKLKRDYHEDLKGDVNLKVQMRPQETPIVRGGFRCYTWTQIVDFLAALRAPYDPAYRDKYYPRPRLLPALTTLRMDLVNFSNILLPLSGSELHDIACHELGCTLNELQITGMPLSNAGTKACAELSGLLKDEGLYLEGPASFIAYSKSLQPLSGHDWYEALVVRAWKGKPAGLDYNEDVDGHLANSIAKHKRLGATPPAPQEGGHPTSTWDENTVIWKKVPTTRDSDERTWALFSRSKGYEIDGLDDSDGEKVGSYDGESYPESSFSRT
ncbi:hypothetical protein ACCO45_010034 [Purpureocillium lilacinum]|uniref:Uncharacterized protein n=1 Tax=Purpureocillium lilacinum TaxID=33203 RepID=A0ACC4DDY9_PURLI